MTPDGLASDLYQALSVVPEPRERQGRRHPIAAVLALVVLASLAGARNLSAVAAWGRRQPPHLVRAMGFSHGRTSSGSTLHSVFNRLDVGAFSDALRHWSQLHSSDIGQAVVCDPRTRLGFRIEEAEANSGPGELPDRLGRSARPKLLLATPRQPQLRRWQHH